jgi:hypothetical protein
MTVQELEEWYVGRKLPNEPIWINNATRINDVTFFVEARFFSIRSNDDPRRQQLCIDKLVQLKEWIELNHK